MILAGNIGKRRRAEELLDMVGLSDRKHHKLSEMSGGEQQRVAIAVALVNRPKMLLADEPTGNLDTKTGHEILELIDELNAEGKTIVMVTHDDDVARRAQRVVCFRDGEIISNDWNGAPRT